MVKALGVTIAAWLLSGIAVAHHSTAEYDRSALRELDGELVAIGWRNPHLSFTLRTIDEAGRAEVWELGGLPIALLEKAGLAESLFRVGDRVKAAGYPSRRRSAMLVYNLLLPSGDEALFYPESRLRWSNRAAGGQWTRDSMGGGDLFRIWSVADLAAYLRAARAVTFQLTPSAEATMAAAAPPTLDVCKPQGMPGFMLNPLPIKFVDLGDRIDLEHTSFGVTRTIYFANPRDPSDIASSDFGHSVGRWQGNVLEVRTNRIAWPFVDDEGRPQSPEVEVIERFELLNGGSRLRYTQTVVDAATLVEPTTVTWEMIDAGDVAIEPVGCE